MREDTMTEILSLNQASHTNVLWHYIGNFALYTGFAITVIYLVFWAIKTNQKLGNPTITKQPTVNILEKLNSLLSLEWLKKTTKQAAAYNMQIESKLQLDAQKSLYIVRINNEYRLVANTPNSLEVIEKLPYIEAEVKPDSPEHAASIALQIEDIETTIKNHHENSETETESDVQNIANKQYIVCSASEDIENITSEKTNTSKTIERILDTGKIRALTAKIQPEELPVPSITEEVTNNSEIAVDIKTEDVLLVETFNKIAKQETLKEQKIREEIINNDIARQLEALAINPNTAVNEKTAADADIIDAITTPVNENELKSSEAILKEVIKKSQPKPTNSVLASLMMGSV